MLVVKVQFLYNVIHQVDHQIGQKEKYKPSKSCKDGRKSAVLKIPKICTNSKRIFKIYLLKNSDKASFHTKDS